MTPRAAGVFTYSPRTPAAPHVCILVSVPQITVYLDRELHQRVKELKVSVSPVCQRALRAEVERLIRDFYARPRTAGGEHSTRREAS